MTRGAGTKRQHVEEKDNNFEDRQIASALRQYTEKVEDDRDRFLRQRDKLQKENESLKSDLATYRDRYKKAIKKANELEIDNFDLKITNKNLRKVIVVNGPPELCYDCFFGSSNIYEHFRSTGHGPPGMGLLDEGKHDICVICQKRVKNLIQHWRTMHPKRFRSDALSQFHLRGSKVKDGEPMIEFPKNIHDTIFATSVRHCNDILPYKKRERKNKRHLNGPPPAPEEEPLYLQVAGCLASITVVVVVVISFTLTSPLGDMQATTTIAIPIWLLEEQNQFHHQTHINCF
jgi:hypothetical protein